MYVRGLALETPALGFPEAPVSSQGDSLVLHGGRLKEQLSRALALIAALGGRVVGLLHADA